MTTAAMAWRTSVLRQATAYEAPIRSSTIFCPTATNRANMGMYCDDNGKVYIIYAADPTNVTIRIVELTSDSSM